MIILIIYITIFRFLSKKSDLIILGHDVIELKLRLSSLMNTSNELIPKEDLVTSKKLFGVEGNTFMIFMITLIFDMLIISSKVPNLLVVVNNFITPAIIVLIAIKDNNKKYKDRLKEVHIEMPIVLQQYYCLISINYSIVEALSLVINNIKDQYLIKEFKKLNESLDSGYDLAVALEGCFSGGHSLYLSRFKGVMLSFYYYGNEESKESFINLINDLMQNRVNLLKEKGEKIKVKMVFPIILIFVASMISLGAPMIIGLNL